MYKDLILTEDILHELIDVDAINNSIKNIFSTPLGSVPGKPKFGSRIFQLIFSLMDQPTVLTIKEIIKEELARFEPRIKLNFVDIQQIPEYNKIVIDINYSFSNNGFSRTSSSRISINQ